MLSPEIYINMTGNRWMVLSRTMFTWCQNEQNIIIIEKKNIENFEINLQAKPQIFEQKSYGGK